MPEVKGPVLNTGDALKPVKAGAMNNQLITAIVVVGLILVAVVVGQLRQLPDLLPKKGPPKTLSIETEKVDKEIFVKSAGERIEALERERDQLQRTRDIEHKDREVIRAQIDDLSKRLSELKSSGVTVAAGGPRGPGVAGTPGSFPPLPPPISPSRPSVASAQPVSAPVVKSQIPSPGVANGSAPASSGPSASLEPSQEGIHVLFKVDPSAVKKASEKKYWLNTGTIIPVRLISGMDAPARAGQSAGSGGGSSGAPSSSPYPVLMVIRDMAKLPNEVSLDARECFILGEGVGELSSERVQIRGTTLSCVKSTGEAVDIELKGFVNGEDSKLGLRGRVVFKEGAVLGRALMAGFISGISQAFMPYRQGITISQSPQQAFNFPSPDRLGMAGAAGGMGNAARLLEKHYSQMAASIFPVIEIDANRDVDFIVGTGRELVDFFL